MPRHFPLLIVLALSVILLQTALAMFPEPGKHFYPNDDIYALDDTGAQLYPVVLNPYRLVLPDMVADFMDFVWVTTYEMYIRHGYSSTIAEKEARSEWDECNYLFCNPNAPFVLTKPMQEAIKRAAKNK